MKRIAVTDTHVEFSQGEADADGRRFGADVDLLVKGDYRITTKIALGVATLVDEFVYTVK